MKTVFYFSTPSCAPCKMFKPIIEQVSRELNISVNYINAEYDPSLIHKYSVTSVPTIVIADQNGTELYKKVGVMSRDQVINMFNQFK